MRRRGNRTEDRSEEWKSISKYIQMPTRIEWMRGWGWEGREERWRTEEGKDRTEDRSEEEKEEYSIRYNI